MRNTKKKGFTIVELVVVVAVIAILAAVLIPTFSGIIKKSRLNADEQTVTNMNKAVAEAESQEEFVFAADAVNALYAKGFNIGKLEPFSKGFHYAYDFESNQFYLLDATATVVFPKNTNVEAKNLWGFFNNQKSDKIADAEGDIVVTKYIALSSITDAAVFNGFDCVFGSPSNYEIDLNGKSITVADTDGEKNITLVNGAYLDSIEEGYTISNGATKKISASNENIEALTVTDGVLTFDGMLFNTLNDGKVLRINTNQNFPSATTVEFKNCVFDLSGKDAEMHIGNTSTSVKNYIYENCTFSLDGKCVQLYGNAEKPNLTIKNCTISSGRGINISNASGSDASVFTEVLVEGNVFIDNGTASGKPSLQFAGSSSDSKTTTNKKGEFVASKITIKDNEFICKDIAIRIHDSILKMNCSNVIISGNKIDEGVVTVADDGTKYTKQVAAEWAAKVQ